MVSFTRLAFLPFCRPAATSALNSRAITPRSRIHLAGIASITAAAWKNHPGRGVQATTTPTTVCEAAGSTPTTTSSSSSRRFMSTTDNSDMSSTTGYLNAKDAAALDVELMSTPGFSLEQLMELAGLSVAEAVYDVVPSSTTRPGGKKPRILLICGPGNNGGDGLVAARHLVMFGYDAVVAYPKRSSKEHFVNLVKQCEDVGVPVLDEVPSDVSEGGYEAIVDAIFGFSFKGEPREPFATALKQMVDAQKAVSETGGWATKIISVDVPSGWNVDEGDTSDMGFMPDVLVSLTTPKTSAKKFTGRHFVGGRFLPPKLAEKYNVQMPPYPGMPPYRGTKQVIELTRRNNNTVSSNAKKQNMKDEEWALQYSEYLAEKEATEIGNNSQEDSDKNVSSLNLRKGDEDWAVAYAEYCAEKEKDLFCESGDGKQSDETGGGGEEEEEEDWRVAYAKYCAEKEEDLKRKGT